MSITITGKLNKAANQFQAGESVGFNVRLGVKFYNRTTKADEYTNYSAVIFAKAPAQVQFYQNALVEGAIIEVSGDKCRIDQYQGQNGLSLSIEILDAKLGFVFSPNSQPAQRPQQPAQAPQYQQPQQAYNQQQAPQRQQPPQGYQQQIGQPMQQVGQMLNAPDFDQPF